MTKLKTGELELIQYYREKRPPTLKQFIHRKHVTVVMDEIKGQNGVTEDPTGTGRRAPKSAFSARDLLKGKTAEQVMAEHPDWVEEYRRLYPDGTANKEA